jgi:uncharacterized protein (TIGR00369 family)
MSAVPAPPEHYQELPRGLGFTDNLQPVYRREIGDQLTLGMYVQVQHCNMIGICHGGALMTLADIAAAQAVNRARAKLAATPTLNLNTDFISAAREGDWIEASADRVELKKRFGFASGVVTCGEKLICRFNGTFYLPDHDGYDEHLSKIAKLHGQG